MISNKVKLVHKLHKLSFKTHTDYGRVEGKIFSELAALVLSQTSSFCFTNRFHIAFLHLSCISGSEFCTGDRQ